MENPKPSVWWPTNTVARVAVIVFMALLFFAGVLMGTASTMAKWGTAQPYSVPLWVHLRNVTPGDLLEGVTCAVGWYFIIVVGRAVYLNIKSSKSQDQTPH